MEPGWNPHRAKRAREAPWQCFRCFDCACTRATWLLLELGTPVPFPGPDGAGRYARGFAWRMARVRYTSSTETIHSLATVSFTTHARSPFARRLGGAPHGGLERESGGRGAAACDAGLQPHCTRPWPLTRPLHAPTTSHHAPQIPDEVTSHYLGLSGFQCSDPRVVRIISLAAHKFVADITNDALQHCKARQQAKGGKEARLTLTQEDLAASCKEFGIHTGKPLYYADAPSTQNSAEGESGQPNAS